MRTTNEREHDEIMTAASDAEAEDGDESQSTLFPSLDADSNLLTALWRDAELLG